MAFRTNKTPVLQEKSASGAVATFNTALAMPLASCNIAVNAWQEGSGDPSPSNVRAIHGFSEVNATRCGVNLWDEQWELGAYDNITGEKAESNIRIRNKNFIHLPSRTFYFKTPARSTVIIPYNKNKQKLGSIIAITDSRVITLPSGTQYMNFYTIASTYDNNISVNYPSTDTDYHAYTGNIYTIQLGQEVYGAEVDVVNGVAHCTHKIGDMGNINWVYLDSLDTQFFYGRSDAVKTSDSYVVVPNILADIYKTVDVNILCYNTDYMVSCGSTGYYEGYLFVKNPDYTDATLFKQAMTNHKICYELRTPIDIQLTPQQIETLIGNNTIFADTGDIDLTFKDLDIAKRGNFREVFKLPS